MRQRHALANFPCGMWLVRMMQQVRSTTEETEGIHFPCTRKTFSVHEKETLYLFSVGEVQCLVAICVIGVDNREV